MLRALLVPILFIVFYAVLTPIWVLARRRRDPLHREFRRDLKTYWTPLTR